MLKMRKGGVQVIDLCITCSKDAETCDSYGEQYTLENGCITRCEKYTMSEEQAKRIIRDDPRGDILQRLMALAVAEQELGTDCTMEDIWKWADK